MGVWIFFVISGFVITLSLVREQADGKSTGRQLKYFYIRRAVRILPIYILTIIFGIAVLLIENKFQYYVEHIPYLITFLYNFYRIDPNYVHTPIFGHFWSLSVEEQFYLLFPLLFLSSSDRARKRILLLLIALGPAVRHGFGLFATDVLRLPEPGNAVFQFSPGHFDAFALGALLALYKDKIAHARYVAPIAVAISLGIVTSCIVLSYILGLSPLTMLKFNTFHHGSHVAVYSMINLTTGAIIICCITGYPKLAVKFL